MTIPVETWAELEAYLKQIRQGVCPYHQRPMTMRQVGVCVYSSCGCRLYEGTVPPKTNSSSTERKDTANE